MKKKEFSSLLANLSVAQRDNNSDIAARIIIKEDLRALIPPLTAEEISQLESNILSEGVRDPLILWQNGEEVILVDGHNRYSICKKHDLSFPHRFIKLDSYDAVKDWMILNQLGRRNLTPQQQSYLRGLRYLREKSQGERRDLTSDQNDKKSGPQTTAARLANEYNVGEATIIRDAEFAKGVEIIEEALPGTRQEILNKEINISKADVQLVGKNKKSVEDVLQRKNPQPQPLDSRKVSATKIAAIAFSFFNSNDGSILEVAQRLSLPEPIDPLEFFITWQNSRDKLEANSSSDI